MLAVSDDGDGMDKDVLNHIFEPFFTTKAVGKGTGLGLASAYGIVRQHEGQILVDSEVGRGTRFELRFPCYRGPVASGAERGPEPVGTGGGSGTILVVEDQEQVRRMLEKILGRLGYRIVTAGGGDEALRQVAELGSAPDLLITDVVMPGLNGRDLYRHLRVQFPMLPVLFISGYVPDMDGVQGEVLAKPFNPAELAAKVKQLLAR
jgi:CheY-like chemotaxis protein